MNESHDKARDLADEVSRKIEEGSDKAAKRAFNKGWKDTVPALPYRISLVLVRIDQTAIFKMLSLIRDGKERELKISGSFDDGFCVKLIRGPRIGDIAFNDIATLRGFGRKQFKQYVPHLLEVSADSDGSIEYVAIELLRKEKRICSSCGEAFFGDTTNCPDCRKLRRRVGEEAYEHPPVAFMEAIDELLEAEIDLPDEK